MLKLCAHVNPRMDEEEKTCYLLHGLQQEIREKMSPCSAEDFKNKLCLLQSPMLTKSEAAMPVLVGTKKPKAKAESEKAPPATTLMQTAETAREGSAEEIKHLGKQITHLQNRLCNPRTRAPRLICHNCRKAGHFRRDCR